MTLSVIMLLVAQTTPGPIDAFRANLAAAKVQIEFEQTSGTLAASEFSTDRIWKGELGFVPNPKTTVVGVWASDGMADYYSYGYLPTRDASKNTEAVSEISNYLTDQLLYDGELAIRRRKNATSVDVMLTRDPALGQGAGPFLWDQAAPFPLILKQQFPSYQPKRFPATINGHPTEAEIYYRDQSDGWHQLEVFYDVNSNYMPIFIRMVKNAKDQNIGFVRSTYFTNMKHCQAGGIVPEQWFSVFFVINGFEKKYANYNAGDELSPQGPFSVDRFRVTKFSDMDKPVRLLNDQGVAILSSYGGQTSAKAWLGSLTVSNIKTALGSRIRSTEGPILPHLDANEVAQMTPSSKLQWQYYGIALIAIAVIAAFILRGYPGMFGCRKLLSDQEASRTQRRRSMPRCGRPTPPTSPTSSGRSSSP